MRDLLNLNKVGQLHKINCGLKRKAHFGGRGTKEKANTELAGFFLLVSSQCVFLGHWELATHGAGHWYANEAVLLGLSSGLQLGRHRYARKVNQSAGMGAGRGPCFFFPPLSDQFGAPHLAF